MIYPEDNRERNSAIVRMYADGYSYGYIATELRLSRNQVAGVIFRSGAKRRRGVEHVCKPRSNQYWSAA